jgi:hypothetical protein
MCTVFDERVNTALDTGVVQLRDEEMACEALDFTHGELELLLRILCEADAEAAVADLRTRLAKREKPRMR